MEFHVIELPTKLKENASDILLCAKFINAEKKEEFDMLATKNPYIKSAYEQLQVISQDKQKRLEYETREKAIRDYNQLMYEAEQHGEQRIPFAISREIPNKYTLEALEEVKQMKQNPNIGKSYTNVDEMMKELL